MSHLSRQDADLHDENGGHISTARTANGSDVERHERRIRRHLAQHDMYTDRYNGSVAREERAVAKQEKPVSERGAAPVTPIFRDRRTN